MKTVSSIQRTRCLWVIVLLISPVDGRIHLPIRLYHCGWEWIMRWDMLSVTEHWRVHLDRAVLLTKVLRKKRWVQTSGREKVMRGKDMRGFHLLILTLVSGTISVWVHWEIITLMVQMFQR